MRLGPNSTGTGYWSNVAGRISLAFLSASLKAQLGASSGSACLAPTFGSGSWPTLAFTSTRRTRGRGAGLHT
eukprot:1354390-Alexandrium_andersonii.AAC.1